MMSSEEDADCFGLYGDKLSKKAKRARQRVDAGEPRNSYSSIPNFSSRPSFFTGGIYGAFFSQTQQQFGIFGQGFGPKMLNELLGRQVKDAATPGDTMMTVDSAGADGSVNFDCLNASSVIRRGLEENGSPPPGELEHHVLRDYLQGRKKELLALEQELRAVNALTGTDPPSPDNNNSIKNNNNNELKNGVVTNNGDVSDDGGSGVGKSSMVNGANDSDSGEEDDRGGVDETAGDKAVTDKEDLTGAATDSEPASPAPSSDNKDDADELSGNKDSTVKTEQLEIKRARVENIVSSMRSSPSLLHSQVNGCKKRKRYHPQQHDNSAAERYAAMGINMNMSMLMDDDDEDDLEPSEIRQKRVEKDALKSQLRTMQEQLAEMQQKYVQLCTRMDQENECPDNDDASSDLEQDASNLTMPDKPVTSVSVTTPVKENASNTPATTPLSQPIMSPAVSKMIPSKLHSHANPSHMPPQHMPIPPSFNGALSLLQQQVLQEQHGPHGPMPHHHLHPHPHSQMPPHHALSNAAAMYLGVSHKLYLEQEARMAKEAAMAAEHQHQQHMSQQHHSHPQHMMSHHQQQQTQPIHQQPQQQGQQQPPQPMQQQQGSQTPHSQPPTPHVHTPTQSSTQTLASTPQQSQHTQMNQSPPQPPSQPKGSSDFTERLNMLRSQALAPPVSGSDLEGLADVLKTEITSSLSNLIDSIMSRFVQQRRFFGKQSEAAAVAAEQLNKDLLLASQLLDRKSPRSKVIDRGNQGPPERTPSGNINGSPQVAPGPPRVNGTAFPTMSMPPHHSNSSVSNNSSNNNNPENNINTMNLPHVRPSPNQALFQPPKPPTSSINSAAAAALYNTMSSMGGPHTNPFCVSDSREGAPEQNEALSLVVAPKKKRHKVTDTRITPRTVSRILAQDGIGAPPQRNLDSPPKFNMIPSTSSNGGDSPPPRPYHPPPPPMLPVSLPTSVAIPNPSLHESQVFSPYSPWHHQPPHMPSASPPGMAELRESPPLHPPTLLHPALLAAAQHGSPDYGSMRTPSAGLGAANDSVDRSSDCNSVDGPYDGNTPTISFSGNTRSIV